MFIPIRNDNGFEECPSCKHCETDECRLCSDAELFEEIEEAGEKEHRRELDFA